jgi:hypothetical protein
MTEFSTFSRRRRADRNVTTESNNINDDSQNSPTLPSRIPIKSPARSLKPIGGMTIAYSPIKSGSEAKSINNSIADTKNNNYSKKLMELKNAMDLLKTPPAASSSSSASGPLQSQYSHISYTPLKSSTLATRNNLTSPFASSIDAIEISMASSSSDDTGNDTSLLDAYREDEDDYSSNHKDSFIKTRNNNNIFSSPQNSVTSSPFISSEELKKKLEATKEAFQRSLEAQKCRLRTSLPFSEIDSSFSFCAGFDSDLSVDSLKDTREQLEKIKKEMTEIVESDFEEVKLSKNNNSYSNDGRGWIKQESLSWSSVLFKYFVIFSISTIIFVHLFMNYFPKIQSTIISFLSSFENVNFLEKFEETLNFLLQD